MVMCQSVRMVMSWIGHWYGCVSECQDAHVWIGHCYGCVSECQDGHVLDRALQFEDEGRRKNGRPQRTWKSRLRKQARWFVLGRFTSPIKVH